MKNNNQDSNDLYLMLIVLGIAICSLVAFSAGKRIKQKENKSNNIEYIVFGEQQL